MTAAPKKRAAAKAKKKATVKRATPRKTPKKTGRQRAPAKKAPAKKTTPQKAQSAPAAPSAPHRVRAWLRRGFYICCACVAVLFLVTLLWAGSLRFVNPPFTGLMLLRHFGEGQPINQVWRDYEDISPHLLVAVLAAEDQRFYDHHGFDLKEIQNAIEAHAEGGKLRGASTLSQQTAKNVFLWPARSWWRKGAEAYFTVLIECLWPKRRILEVYVNVAEMGPGVYGVESAAQRYFHTSAGDLSAEQAALLASILPSPLTRDPRAPTAYMKKRQGWILRQMNNLGGASFLK